MAASTISAYSLDYMLSIQRGIKSFPSRFTPQQAQPVGSRRLSTLLLATVVSGVNYYYQETWKTARIEEEEKIIQRVNEKETLGNIEEIMGANWQNDVEGKLIQVKGELRTGRFMVKRKRGDQEGYMVLAPFTVRKDPASLRQLSKVVQNKFVLNLGWVPLESKHKLRQVAAIDILDFDELPEELADDENAPITETVTAYVRRGEHRDISRGYNNWWEERLFKFIDLDLVSNIFGIVNNSSRFVYLDRVQNEGDESFPFPNTQENYINELKNNQAVAAEQAKSRSKIVLFGSFSLAFLSWFV